MTQIKTKLLIVFTAAVCFASNVDAASIAKVETKDVNTLKVSFSQAVTLSDTPTGEIKVLKDVAVDTATKDLKNSKVINLTLTGELVAEKSYSLISIFGAEGSMDFSLWKEMVNVEIKNIDTASTIEKIMIVDSKRIDIYYKADVSGAEFEYKILSGLGVESLWVDMDGSLMVKVGTPFESKKDYILMIVSLKDDAGKEITVEDGIYDFVSADLASVAPVDQAAVADTTATWSAAPGPSPVVAEIPPVPLPADPKASVTGTGTEEISAPAANEWNIEEVALNSGSTPDTGAETWVLILATLFINGFVYLYRRKA